VKRAPKGSAAKKSAGRKEPAPGAWKYTVGEPPLQVTAHERADRGLRVYTRVWDGRAYSDRRELCGPIRDDRGRIDPDKEQAARALTIARHRALTSGLAPQEAAPTGPLTLATGLARVLDPKSGKYPTVDEHVRNVRRAHGIIVTHLGGDVRWSDVRHAHYRKLWRAMAHEHVKSGAFGRRWTEMVCECFGAAARWLQQEGLIEPGEGEPARGWKGAMRKEWGEITGEGAASAKPKKPRLAPAEVAALFTAAPPRAVRPADVAANDEEEADPRVWLALEIGAELRIGQVRRVRRSHIEAAPDGKEPLYAVDVHGRGKKLGEYVILTEDQRAALRWALEHGYLADLERAYAAGEIADYHLFPTGHFVTELLPDGRAVKRARLEHGAKPIGRRALADQWARLERLAGVAHLPGRLWYGARRRQADAADEANVSPQAKLGLGGWSKESTREGYLEDDRVKRARAAAEARVLIRPKNAGNMKGGEG
jgi:hypothetical protein